MLSNAHIQEKITSIKHCKYWSRLWNLKIKGSEKQNVRRTDIPQTTVKCLPYNVFYCTNYFGLNSITIFTNKYTFRTIFQNRLSNKKTGMKKKTKISAVKSLIYDFDIETHVAFKLTFLMICILKIKSQTQRSQIILKNRKWFNKMFFRKWSQQIQVIYRTRIF